jgi:hypothetical protein
MLINICNTQSYVDVIRCEVICVRRENGRIIGMNIKYPGTEVAYYQLDQIFKLQAHQKGASEQLPRNTHSGDCDFYIPTIHGGSVLMLVENINGELRIVRPSMNVINVPDCV